MKSAFLDMNKKGKFERTVEIVIHLCIWLYIFLSPLFFDRRGQDVDWMTYFRRLYFPLSSCLVFYVNYFYLAPRFILKDRRIKSFILYNVLLLILLMLSRDLYVMLFPPVEMTHRHRHRLPEPDDFNRWFFQVLFFVRSFVSLAFIAFLGTVVKLSVQWRKAEVARQEAELRRSEAELSNLKNQINPHFLLNTLNNIYALTAFDTEKAQEAISSLSRMLRYMLYENQTQLVSLVKEVEFLHTYIELMRIRLSSNVRLDIQLNVSKDDDHQVAPLIFISLVENAFKHGVSPTQPSFIAISLHIEADHLLFSCRNSNFPKSKGDKSPGGIGLKQVDSRLAHNYPDRHTWHYGVDGDTYYSEIDLTL